MANKTIKTRIQNKYDVEKNWDQASFTPLKGELIFYGPDKDDEGNVLHELPRFKVGDGETPIGELPIVDVSTGGSGTNDYNDLINKPELGTLAAKNEVAKADLAADVQASLDKADSALQSYTETDPTVPAWAKSSSKPTYTASEVGAVPTSRTVNGKALSENITLSASDVGALPSTTDIPDALSDLTDDSTHRTVTDAEKATWNAKSNFDGNYNSLTNKPTLGSLAAKDQVVKADLSSDLQTAIDRVDFANGGTMGGSLVINGDLTVNGTATTVEIFNENVNVEDNTITLRHNTTTGLSSGDYTGIIAHKYDGTNNGMLVFDNTGTAYVGDEGDLQPLATRDLSADGTFVSWDDTNKILVRAPLEKGSGTNSIQQVNNTASGDYSNATGNTTQAVGKSTHSEGTNTVAFGESSHAEGRGSTVTFTAADLLIGTDVLVDKWKQQDVDNRNSAAIGIASHVEGNGNVAAGHDSHAEGRANLALGNRSHAEGSQTEARGNNSHAEGTGTTAGALNSHAEGNDSVASGTAAHAEGNATTASGDNSHAEGYSTEATTLYAHAEGYLTKANGQASHAEGNGCVASNANSHVEGFQTKATANNAHAEGGSTTASGQSSHAEGTNTIASGHSSHASGYGTQATATAQTVVGKNNALNDNALFIVGNGKSTTNRSNAFEVISTSSGVSLKVGNTTLTEAQLNKLISFIDAATYDTASNTWSFN